MKAMTQTEGQCCLRWGQVGRALVSTGPPRLLGGLHLPWAWAWQRHRSQHSSYLRFALHGNPGQTPELPSEPS